MRSLVLTLLLICCGCSGIEDSRKAGMKQQNERKDRVHRVSSEVNYASSVLLPQVRDPYPWEVGYTGIHPPVTKEAFRCKGDAKNPSKEKNGGGVVRDCGGTQAHGLPTRGNKEFVYPILLDLLNYIQVKTNAPVVVTCGHRCPAHNSYADGSSYNINSKHMIGAEVDFYVKGMESKPEEVIALIKKYYKETECYRGKPEYLQFAELTAVKFDVATTPLYNKEVLVKLYKKEEGRDADNNHPYPYISLQVRFDREKNEKVTYSAERAFGGYLRR